MKARTIYSNYFLFCLCCFLFTSVNASHRIKVNPESSRENTYGILMKHHPQQMKVSSQGAKVSVKDFGAIGDGKADDTDAIIRAVKEGGNGLVEFPRGSYRITRTIDILLTEYGPLGLTGSGGSARVIMEGAGPAFRFTGSHHGSASPASVQDITWEKERMPMVEALEIVGKHPDANGLEFQFTHMPVIRAVLIRDVHHGIHLTSRNRNVIISNCHVYNCSGTGIYLDSVNLHQIIINDSHISYCRLGGIKVSRSEIRNFQITGNDIEYNCDLEGEVAADIWIDCSKLGSVREGTISGNTIQAIPGRGGANIRFTGTPGNNRKIGLWSITGNHISNHSINIHLDHTHGISITGNTILRAYDRHMIIENSRNLVVNGNVFDYNSDYFTQNISAPGGITILKSNNIIFSDNLIDGVEYGSQEKGGAVNISESSDISVSACHITNSEYRGIDIENSVNVRVTDCVINEDNAIPAMLTGIELRGVCTGTIIRNNSIGKGKKGKIVNLATGVTLEGN